MRRALRNKPSGEYKAGSVDDAFMRHVAQLSWSSQGPTLAREFLTQHGISLIIERHLTGTYLDGAALLLAPDHPVIGMTLRYDRLNNFWFCLMHELAHIRLDRKSTRLNSSHDQISYAVFCLKKKNKHCCHTTYL